jgi:actin-related protein
VFDGRVLTHLSSTFQVGGRFLTNQLKQALKLFGKVVIKEKDFDVTDEWLETVPTEKWENLKAQLFVLPSPEEFDLLKKSDKILVYRCGNEGELKIPERLRVTVPQSLFEPNEDDLTLASRFIDILKRVTFLIYFVSLSEANSLHFK